MLGELGQIKPIDGGHGCGVGLALGELEKRLARIPEQNFNLSLLALYILLTGITMLAHEMWFDEIQAWLIARDSHDIVDLIHNLRYEGHPALWYLLLMPLTRLSRNPVLMQGLQFTIATVTVAVVLWRAPLLRLERLVFPFGYFTFFEYGVKSRSYTLGFLLLVLFCSLWPQRRKHSILMAVLLAGLANVHLYFAIASAAALACLVVDRIADDSPKLSRQRSDRYWVFPAVLILGVGWVAAAMVAWPLADSGYAAGWSFSISGDRILSSLRVLGALIGSGRWPAVVAGLVVLAIVCSRFRKSPAAAVFLLVTSGGLLAFAYVKLSAGIWAQGVIFLAFLAAVWIDRTKIVPSEVKRSTSSFLIPPGVLVAVLVIQAFLGLGSAVRDIARPYSNASAVARFIRDQGWETDPIVGVPDNFVSTVVGYLESDHFYYANGRRWGSFVVWDSQRLSPIDFETVMHDIDQFGPAVTLVASESEHVDAAVLGRHGFRVVAHFQGAIIPSENYVIYHR